MALGVHDRQPGRDEPPFQGLGAFEQLDAEVRVAAEMADAGERRHHGRRRQRGGEDEPGRDRPDVVHHLGVAGDVAAVAAEPFGERALDDVDATRHAIAFRHAAPLRSIQADGMDLVQVGHRPEATAQLADPADRRDVGVHRIDGFERDQLRRVGGCRGQQFLEMRRIVMAEDAHLGAGALDPGDHGGVVLLVREADPAPVRPIRGAVQNRGQRGLVRHEAGGEQQPGFLAVQIGKLGLERVDLRAGAADVAGAARARAHAVRGFRGRLDHDRAHAHAEIVVGGPDQDFAPVRSPVERKAVRLLLQRREGPVAALALDVVERAAAESVKVMHAGRPTRKDWPHQRLASSRYVRPAIVASMARDFVPGQETGGTPGLPRKDA